MIWNIPNHKKLFYCRRQNRVIFTKMVAFSILATEPFIKECEGKNTVKRAVFSLKCYAVKERF